MNEAPPVFEGLSMAENARRITAALFEDAITELELDPDPSPARIGHVAASLGITAVALRAELRYRTRDKRKDLYDGDEFVTVREDALDGPVHPPCIVRDYLYTGVAVDCGPGGVGKTTRGLFESIHIILGRPLWGLDIITPGPVALVTAEDTIDELTPRLGVIMRELGLSEAERGQVMASFYILDVTAKDRRLCMLDSGKNVVVSAYTDFLCEKLSDIKPVLVNIDSTTYFGIGESRVNDNENALIKACRRIVNEVKCCVRLVHHVGKENARSKTLDQYSARGGSALSDGARMVCVTQSWDESCKEELPPGLASLREWDIQMMQRAKSTYCTRQPLIFLRREGYLFTHWIKVKRSLDECQLEEAAQVKTFLADRMGDGRKYSLRALIESRELLGLSQAKIRRAVAYLKAKGQVTDKEDSGRKQSHLFPLEHVSKNLEAVNTRAKNGDDVCQPDVVCHPYRENDVNTRHFPTNPTRVDTPLTHVDTPDTRGGVDAVDKPQSGELSNALKRSCIPLPTREQQRGTERSYIEDAVIRPNLKQP